MIQPNITKEQMIRMSEAFPNKSSIQIEELRLAEKKDCRCRCGNIHERVIRPAGFYVDGVLVNERVYREIEQKLRWVIDGGVKPEISEIAFDYLLVSANQQIPVRLDQHPTASAYSISRRIRIPVVAFQEWDDLNEYQVEIPEGEISKVAAVLEQLPDPYSAERYTLVGQAFVVEQVRILKIEGARIQLFGLFLRSVTHEIIPPQFLTILTS